MRIEVDDDVTVITLAIALRAYGLQLSSAGDVLKVSRGPQAADGDQRVRAALDTLRDRAALFDLRNRGSNV